MYVKDFGFYDYINAHIRGITSMYETKSKKPYFRVKGVKIDIKSSCLKGISLTQKFTVKEIFEVEK